MGFLFQNLLNFLIVFFFSRLPLDLYKRATFNVFFLFHQLDQPVQNYNTTYLNHGSPHSPQTNNSSLSYPQVSFHILSTLCNVSGSVKILTCVNFNKKNLIMYLKTSDSSLSYLLQGVMSLEITKEMYCKTT